MKTANNQLRPRYLSIDVDMPDDPQLKRLDRTLFKDYPCSAYGFWVILLLYVARFGTNAKLSRSDDAMYDFALKIHISEVQVNDALSALYDKGMIDRRSWTKSQTIYIPGITERLDPYFRRQNAANPPTNDGELAAKKLLKEGRKEGRKGRKEAAGSGEAFDFASLWGKYPRQDGRKEAERHFRASVKSQADYGDICTALQNYVRYVEGERIAPKFIKMGSTWFNNWRDWITAPTEPVRDEAAEIAAYTAALEKRRAEE